MIERSLQFYCRTHRVDAPGRVPGAVVCPQGEILEDDFPRGKRWAYCCDCQRFWLPKVYTDGSKAEKRCPRCSDEIKRWYLCDRCEFITVETEVKPASEKPFTFGGELGPVSCPGCLKKTTGILREHLCENLSIDGDEAADAEGVTVHLTMTRRTCPFCHEEGEERTNWAGQRLVSLSRKGGGAIQADGEVVAEEPAPPAPPWWHRLRPTFKSHWSAGATIAGLVLGVLGLGFSAFAYAFPTAPSHALKAVRKGLGFTRGPTVKIECSAEVFEGGEITLEAKAEDDEDARTLDYQWTCSDPKGRIDWNGFRAKFASAEIRPVTMAVPVEVTVMVTDGDGLSAWARKLIYVTKLPPPNGAPRIRNIASFPQDPQPGASVTLVAIAEDPDRDQPVYQWQPLNGGQIVGEGPVVTYNVPADVPEGGLTATVSLKVDDGRGGVEFGNTIVRVSPRPPAKAAASAPTPLPTPSNNDPQIHLLQPNANPVTVGADVTVEALVTDQDKDKLFYDWEVPDIKARIVSNSPRFIFKTIDIAPPAGGARVTVTLRVIDEHGGRDSKQTTVTVLPAQPPAAPPPQPPSPTPAATPERTPETKTPPEKKPEGVKEQARRGRRPRTTS